jgi:hypothetical protein
MRLTIYTCKSSERYWTIGGEEKRIEFLGGEELEERGKRI